MMPKILKASFLTLVQLGLAGCLDEEDSFDYSQCLDSVDLHLWEKQPWTSTESSQNFALIYETGDTSNPIAFFSREIKVIYHTFICNVERDTCWFSSTTEGVLDDNPHAGWVNQYNNAIRYNSDGNPEVSICQIDSCHYTAVNVVYDYIEFERIAINPTLMLDTNSSPAMRSPYQIWWPLPRIPWPQGESDAADSLVWADSTGSE